MAGLLGTTTLNIPCRGTTATLLFDQVNTPAIDTRTLNAVSRGLTALYTFIQVTTAPFGGSESIAVPESLRSGGGLLTQEQEPTSDAQQGAGGALLSETAASGESLGTGLGVQRTEAVVAGDPLVNSGGPTLADLAASSDGASPSGGLVPGDPQVLSEALGSDNEVGFQESEAVQDPLVTSFLQEWLDSNFPFDLVTPGMGLLGTEGPNLSEGLGLGIAKALAEALPVLDAMLVALATVLQEQEGVGESFAGNRAISVGTDSLAISEAISPNAQGLVPQDLAVLGEAISAFLQAGTVDQVGGGLSRGLAMLGTQMADSMLSPTDLARGLEALISRYGLVDLSTGTVLPANNPVRLLLALGMMLAADQGEVLGFPSLITNEVTYHAEGVVDTTDYFPPRADEEDE